jgi:hypothetical protein
VDVIKKKNFIAVYYFDAYKLNVSAVSAILKGLSIDNNLKKPDSTFY